MRALEMMEKNTLNVSHHNPSLSVSLSLIPALNISFIRAQRPLKMEQDRQMQKCMWRTQYGLAAFFAPQCRLKRCSHTALMTGAKLLQRQNIRIPVSVSILSGIKHKQELSSQNGTRTETVFVRQGQKWALHVEKQLMQMMFSNNSIQAALAGERKRTMLIAREQAGKQMSRWMRSMLPFRNQAR